MHLKQQLQIELMKRPDRTHGTSGGCPPAWLLTLELTTIVTLLAGSVTALGADQLARQKRQDNAHHHERKCVPVLGYFAPPQKVSNVTQQTNGQQTSGGGGGGGMPDSFVFPIGDIDMPLAQTGGSVQTAMKFLAAFDSQMPGFDSSDDETADSGNGNGDNDDDDDDEGQALARENSIKFVQNRLHISGLNLTMLKVNLYQDSEPKFGLGVNIANTTLIGQFHYSGLAPSLLGGDLYSKLAGHYRMSIDNVLITASSNLTKRQTLPPSTRASSVSTFSNNKQQQQQQQELMQQQQQALFNYKLTTNDFKMNISNLGYISIDILDAKDSTKPTSNYMLKMLQRVLQKTIKRTYNKFEAYISKTLETEGRRFLDCELTRFSPLLIENVVAAAAAAAASTNNSLDLLSAESGAKFNVSSSSSSSSPQHGLSASLNAKQNNNSNSNNNLDDLARIISSEISNSRLARVDLPNFDYHRSILGTNALIEFTNGSLSGLDNVNLNGETKIKLQDNHLIVNASVGWSNLKPAYNWTLYLGAVPPPPPALTQRQDLPVAAAAPMDATGTQLVNLTQTVTSLVGDKSLNSSQQASQQRSSMIKPMARGFVAFNIKAIDFDALISKGLGSQTRLTVDQLTIKRLDGPKMDIGGLPGVNRLTRSIVNFFMGRLKQRLVTSVQPALKQELERVLNRLAPFQQR